MLCYRINALAIDLTARFIAIALTDIDVRFLGRALMADWIGNRELRDDKRIANPGEQLPQKHNEKESKT